MAAAIALWAVGLAIQATPRGDAGGLFLLAEIVAAAGTLLFVGDLALLGRSALAQRRAGRIARPLFGRFDYVPELTRAVGDYVGAQSTVNQAMNDANPVLQQHFSEWVPGLSADQQQALVNQTAKVVTDVAKVVDTNLPVLKEKMAVIVQCQIGVAKTAGLGSDADVKEFTSMRDAARLARKQTAAFGETLKVLRQTMLRTRKQNLGLTLNTATEEIVVELGDYRKVVAVFVRDSRIASVLMWRRLTWRSLRLRLRLGR